jgi:hypothetical protein
MVQRTDLYDPDLWEFCGILRFCGILLQTCWGNPDFMQRNTNFIIFHV